MKRIWAAAAIVAVIAGLFLVLNANHHPPETNPSPGQVSNASLVPNPQPSVTDSGIIPAASAVGAGADTTPPNSLASRAASPTPPPTNEVQNLPPLTILDNARVVMHNYCSTFGENPVGTNPEITAALTGKNSKQINFVTPESGLRVNENGEMLDGYGTPFFFHQLSGTVMEIRSAGEDQKMWTFDDQVAR